jgi:hypothetical protein
VELRDHVNALANLPPPRDAWWFVNGYAPFVHVPLDEPWTFGRRPRYVAAPAWLDGEPLASEAEAFAHLVRRYLGAFGPASVGDAAAWSRLSIRRLRAAFEALDAAGELARFSDATGRRLFDLVDAPRPPGDTPAPPRLLPMWDSTILAYADRTRIISDADRALVIARNGDTLPTFLVDGEVAGLWWAEPGQADRVTRIVFEPSRALDARTLRALEREGERLAGFVGPIEPRVFARYRGSLARRGPNGAGDPAVPRAPGAGERAVS